MAHFPGRTQQRIRHHTLHGSLTRAYSAKNPLLHPALLTYQGVLSKESATTPCMAHLPGRTQQRIRHHTLRGSLTGGVYIGSNPFFHVDKLRNSIPYLVHIPETVTEIKAGAFKGCSSLTDVLIPNSVTSMGDSVFRGCTGLVSAKISESLTEIPDYTFCECTSLSDVKIPASVKTLCAGSFQECRALTAIEIPDTVTKFENSVFQKCSGLVSITIPPSVDEIADYTKPICRIS